jgi:ATP-dependent DNA helicase DinG
MTAPSRATIPTTAFRLPDAPLLAAGLSEAVWITGDGEIEHLDPAAATARAGSAAPVLCHAKATARRLGCAPFAAYDLLELFAFVRPASFCVPTPRGLADALGLPPPEDLEAAAVSLRHLAMSLLRELAARGEDAEAVGIAWTMAEAGWLWGPPVLAALGFAAGEGQAPRRGRGLNVWDRLPDWEDAPPPPAPGGRPVQPGEARGRLAALLEADAESRPQQGDYASAVSQAFQPANAAGEPHLVLAEAGTGIGKTLGYIAPASLWAERNQAPVWISTFTRNLQHQIDAELGRLFPAPAEKSEKVVIRKGRENYLCLLNLQEAVRALPTDPGYAVAVGLMARWAAHSRDGDMVGGDFPGWLVDLLGRARTLGLTDRRGECIYSACQHYGKCFIERSIRRARHAQIVVANHALVMVQAAMGGGEDGQLPSHYVFDEGHHLFGAADSAFAAHLSGMETHELRRWLIGAEGRRPGRARGLKRRMEDLLSGDEEMIAALDAALTAARALPGEGWRQRLEAGRPQGPSEQFLAAVRQQVYARDRDSGSPYSLECETRPAVPGLLEAAAALALALEALLRPLKALRQRLAERLDEDSGELPNDNRRRIDALCRSLERRGTLQVGAWREMLKHLEQETPAEYCDWFAVERLDGRDLDLGMYRHWVDPTRPFAETVLASAQGAVVTSATLTDASGDQERDWQAAEARVGAGHLPNAAIRALLSSPFDYAAQTRVFLVTGVNRTDMDQVAAAYRELFLAAGGGGLGLFTAISRLRAVQERIGGALERSGLTLYSQHVDGLDTSTLVDIFRAEEDSCLLGTDAVRDGVDVPGRALRLIVFDRVPWARPDLRHKARRLAFGQRDYDDRLARLKLRQAYGRLIRRTDDRGVFVMLDPRMPSRLIGAFPPEVTVERLGLAEVIRETAEFLGS